MESQINVNVYKKDTIAVIEMDGGQNRVNFSFCEKMLKAFDEVESWKDVKAVITTGKGRFYSNGLDLDYLLADDKNIPDVGLKLTTLFKRILNFPIVTIAAVNGHCFAAGFLLAIVHDYRVMQNDRGFMCMNEIDIGLSVTKEMVKVFSIRVHPNLLREIYVMGKRFTSQEALKVGLADRTAPLGDALNTAIEYGKELTNNRKFTRASMEQVKKTVYSNIDFDNIFTPAAKL